MSVLAFDMGIRNLAYCVTDSSGSIIDWNNYDLLAGTDSQSSSRCSCGGPPSFTDISGSLLCKKCVKSKRLSSIPLTSVTLKTLKELSEKENWNLGKKAKKEDFFAAAASRYLMPYVKPKGAAKTDLTLILEAINLFLDDRLELFSTCSSVRIENQPALANPTMKSVQIILFTLIVHRLRKEKRWSGAVTFVHASKKTDEEKEAVANAGNNYKARKDMAEQLVLKKLPTGKWREFFLSKSKKSDLADCYLMCLR